MSVAVLTELHSMAVLSISVHLPLCVYTYVTLVQPVLNGVQVTPDISLLQSGIRTGVFFATGKDGLMCCKPLS